MTAQETKLLNAFETTLSTTLGSSGTTVTLTAVTDSASNNIEAPCYLVIEPDSATNREYVLVSAVNIGTKTITLGDGGASNRHLKGSAATSGLSHASGSTIRYVPMAQHFEDLNDRIDANFNEAGTQIVAGNAVKDEDNMSSNSATHLATQQSIKAYVDTQLTAEDLDITDGSTTSAVDLDSQTLTIQGTSNEVDVGLSGQTFTIGLPSTITANVTGNVSGTSGSTTGNAATATALQTARNIGGVSFDGTANINLPGVNTAGNQNTSGNSATATALETARNIGGVSFDGTGNIDLPGVNTTGNQNTSGSSASTTGNAATATALQTARNIGGVSFDGTGNIDLPGVNSAGNQNTSGTAAGLSATLAVASGGTGATSFADKSVIITQDSGTDTLAAAAMDANGELLIGGTSGPAVATLTAGSNITITNSDGGIEIAASGGDVTASSTTTFTNKTIDADGTGNSISNIDIGNMTSAVVVTESDGIASNDNDTTLPTSAAVKDYVDTNAGGVSLGLVLALS